MNEFLELSWKFDVEAFARWRGFYDSAHSDNAKRRALETLRRLQDRWPNHKLGDMPAIGDMEH